MRSNYMILKNFNPWRKTIMYIDLKDVYLADGYFCDREIPVRFKKEGIDESDPSNPFCFIIISFRKKYSKEVAGVLDQLNKMIALKYGHRYELFKRKAGEIFEGWFEERSW